MEHKSVNKARTKTIIGDRTPSHELARSTSQSTSFLLRLHQSIGNWAVGRLLQSRGLSRPLRNEERKEVQSVGLAATPMGTDSVQRMGSNAPLGETVRLPVMDDVVKSPTVESSRRTDWEAGLKDYNERGGWIFWQGSPPYDREKGEKRDDVRGSYDIRPWNMAVGALDDDPSSDPRDVIDPGNPPTNDSLSFLVGHYHQHPPLDPSMNRNPANFPVGPSDADRKIANDLGNPGIVRDFTDPGRTTVADYRYGPTEQTRN